MKSRLSHICSLGPGAGRVWTPGEGRLQSCPQGESWLLWEAVSSLSLSGQGCGDLKIQGFQPTP